VLIVVILFQHQEDFKFQINFWYQTLEIKVLVIWIMILVLFYIRHVLFNPTS
jgi:hypothetical protein